MRTSLSHSRQLRLKSAAGKLPCDHMRQRNAERWFGYWSTKSEETIEKQKTPQKFSNKFQTRMQQHKSAFLPVALVHAICISY